jgi:hypothetical protein
MGGVMHPEQVRKGAEVAFQAHAATWFLVNLFLIGVWAVTMFGGYFWPIWPIMGWGLAVAIHGWATYGTRGI